MKKTLYGIPNCDTVKKARTWLADNGHDFAFHDFKKQGLDRETAARWLDGLDWETLVNRKGTTWRKLDDETRDGLTAANAAALLSREPSLVKRPVFAYPGGLAVGFAKADEAAVIGRLRSSVR